MRNISHYLPPKKLNIRDPQLSITAHSVSIATVMEGTILFLEPIGNWVTVLI